MYLALQRGSWELITSGLSVGPEWKSVPGARLDYRLAGLQLLWERVVLGSSIHPHTLVWWMFLARTNKLVSFFGDEQADGA